MLVRNAATLGHVLRQRRKDLGLTQQQAADKASVSRLWLSQVENGHPTAQFAELNRAARALGLVFALQPEPPVAPDLAAIIDGSID